MKMFFVFVSSTRERERIKKKHHNNWIIRYEFDLHNKRWVNNIKPTINNNRSNTRSIDTIYKIKANKKKCDRGSFFSVYILFDFQRLEAREVYIYFAGLPLMDSLMITSLFNTNNLFGMKKKYTENSDSIQNMGSHTNHVKQSGMMKNGEKGNEWEGKKSTKCQPAFGNAKSKRAKNGISI